MYSLLLAIIYIAFISLGLPDSLLGSAWPIIQLDLNVATSFMGILTMLISGGTIVSSLFSDKLTRKFGAGLVTTISVLMTAAALFGFSISNSFFLLCLWSIPYGLGAGAIDAALNNFVALHYASRHMSWLHCFWGVGAAISPYIMSYNLTGGYGWNHGYRIVSFIQIGLSILLFVTLPLWKQKNTINPDDQIAPKALSFSQVIKIKGVPLVLITFFAYCALEQTAGVWASTYLVQFRNIDAKTAASFASFFYLGITVGRFLCGFVADRLGDKRLIRIGILTLMVGVLMVAIPISYNEIALVGLIVIGFGCAPIYPSIIHATPSNFGKENSQAVIGIQMASAYVGSTFMPPVFGFLASLLHIGLYPIYLLLFAGLMLVMSEKLNHLSVKKKEELER